MRENLGAGSHVMIEVIPSNIRGSMNASSLQIPFKYKSGLETEARSILCAKNTLILHFSQVYLPIRNFSWAVNRQTDPNLYYYTGWTASEEDQTQEHLWEEPSQSFGWDKIGLVLPVIINLPDSALLEPDFDLYALMV